MVNVDVIDDLAGLGADRFFQMLGESVVHGDLRGSARAAVVGCDHGGLFDRRRRDLAPIGADDHVGAGDLLRVQPQVAAFRGLERQAVVLQVVAADQDAESVRRAVFERGQGLGILFVPFALSLEIPGLLDLVAQRGQLRARVGPASIRPVSICSAVLALRYSL